MKFLFYIGTGKYSLSEEEDLLKISPGELPGSKKIVKGSKNILRDVQEAYKKLFQDSDICSYYCKINESKKLSLATGILIRLGNKKDWGEKKKENKTIEKIYKKQIKIIKKEFPFFFIVNATIYFLEVPILRIVGIPFKEVFNENNNIFEKRICKNYSFNQKSIIEKRKKLEEAAKTDFNNLFCRNIKNEQDYYQMQLFYL